MFKGVDNLSDSITQYILKGYNRETIKELNDGRELRVSLRSMRSELREKIPEIEEEEKGKETNIEHGSIL